MRVAICILLCAAVVQGYYLPGISPRTYDEGERVKMRVNKLTSSKTLLPFDYYTLPFPKPHKGHGNDYDGIHEVPENLGEYLTGEAIMNSPYMLYMLRNETCKIVERSVYSKEDVAVFKKRIEENYHVNWILDNLPSAAAINDIDSRTQTTAYDVGWPLGSVRQGHTELNNHVVISVSYHKPLKSLLKREHLEKHGRVVGFMVEPISVKHKYSGKFDKARGGKQITTCYKNRPMPSLDTRRKVLVLEEGAEDFEVIWTYDVVWLESDIEWASRWDIYLSMANRYDDEVHWFSIVNAALIALFLTGMVGMIMVRALNADIAHYNRILTDQEREEQREDTGWKLVCYDVFRPPANFPMLFCVFTGSGMQLLVCTCILVFFAAAGFLSPARRGAMMMAMLLIFVAMGMTAGYSSSRSFKMFKGSAWKQNTLYTALIFPGVAFGICFILNLFVWAEGSSRAVPFGSLVVVMLLWFGVSTPLVYVGAYFGFAKESPKFPVQVNRIPRQVPPQPWYLTTSAVMLMGGVLPFGAIFVELYFIFSALWLNQFYYVFGFLLLIVLILIVTTAEVTIVLCYFQLCSEDYHWWWRSFLTAGSTGVYIYAYSFYYFFTQMDTLYLVSGLLYFGYSFIIAFAFFLLCGTIGYYSCWWFVNKIYSAVKVD
jgi:transmembrane 9 superfamily protein 2/4